MLQFIQLCCVTNVFIAAKFVVMFSLFLKTLNVIASNQLYSFEFLKRERDWKFLLIQVFNNRRCFLCVIEIYQIMNLIFLTLYPMRIFIYLYIFIYFPCLKVCNLIKKETSTQVFSFNEVFSLIAQQPQLMLQIFYSFLIFLLFYQVAKYEKLVQNICHMHSPPGDNQHSTYSKLRNG